MKQKFFIFSLFAVIFATVFGSSVYAALPDSLNGYPNIWADKPSVLLVLYEDNDGVVHALNTSTDSATEDNRGVKFTLSGSNIIVENSLATRYRLYTYDTSTGAWDNPNLTSLSAGSARTLGTNVSRLIYTNYQVVDPNGNVVFPQPPAPPKTPLEVAVMEGLTDLQAETMTTMEILTLCGVGLMALLVALVILPKVLYKFL